MTDPARVSRRGLFTLGIARVAEDLVPAKTAPRPAPTEPARPIVDRDAWSERREAARLASDAGGLWTPVATAVLAAAAQTGDRGRLLAVGDADLAPVAAADGWTVSVCDDARALPFGDGCFDGAVSSFAAMFSLDARGAIAELFRVVRPGGTVAFAAWRRSGIVGRLLLLAAEHDPAPREVPAPLTWGREERLRQDLGVHSDHVSFTQHRIALGFESRQEAVERLFSALPPLAAVPDRAALWAAAEDCVDALAQDGPSPVSLSAPYLVARATRS